MKEPKYKIGDRVRVVNYGSLLMTNEEWHKTTLAPIVLKDGNIVWLDIAPELVGKEGTVKEASSQTGLHKYAIEGIPGKTSWYTEGQMEKVN